MRKVVLALILSAAMLVAGCCTGADGSKSFMNCMRSAQTILCNPPADVVQAVNYVAPVIAMILNTAVPGTAAYINAVTAQQVVTALQAGACVTLTQLNQLIAYMQSDVFKTEVAKLAKGPAMPTPVPVDPLIKWRNTKSG